jgi:hypothetical protein
VAAALSDWGGLAALAEAHGLAPLLLTYLQAAGVAIPLGAKQQLLGFYMQHAHAARARELALSGILTCFRAAEIDVLALTEHDRAPGGVRCI